MVPCSGSAGSDRFVQHVVRGVEFPVRCRTLSNPCERVTSRDVLAVPLVIECYKGSRVDEELQLESP